MAQLKDLIVNGNSSLIGNVGINGVNGDYNLYVNGTGYFSDLVTTSTGNHKGTLIGNTYITAINGDLILQNNNAIRFGTDAWDYNQWAGLKYVHSSKSIYLGLADGIVFDCNNSQSDGILYLPGIRYFSINGKTAIDATDSWLRINQGLAFSDGIYTGSSLIRSDNQLQVGSGGNAFYANSSGNGYFSNTLGVAGTNTSYKLYVNGASYFNGNTFHNGIDYFANGATYYINNSADAKLRYLALGGLNPTSSYQLYVNGTSWIKGLLWTRNLQPESDKTYDLGSSTYYWRDIYTKGVIRAYRYNTSKNLPFITFDKPGSYAAGIGPDGTANRIIFGPVSGMDGSTWVAQSTFNDNEWYFQGKLKATNTFTAVSSSYFNSSVYVNTNSDSSPFYITRTGGTGEAAAHSVNDSVYTIAYTNDETSSSIRLRLINTDTEDGTQDNTTDYSYYFDSSGNITGGTFSGTSNNADKLDGYHGSSSATANTYVLRNGSNYIHVNYINSNTSNNENPSISQFIVTNGSDHFYRKASLAHVRNSLAYPRGFIGFTSGVTWGNTIGTSFCSWNDPTGGSIDFRQDNPSSGKMSIKVDGRVYVNEGNNAVMGMTLANDYWGMGTPDGNATAWIRTTVNGILPYQSGGSSAGHCGLGTSSWYFSYAYIQNIYGYLNGNISGSATSLTTNAGSSTQPIYFSGGKPVATSYTLGANIKSYTGSLASGGWATLNGKANSPSIAISYNSGAASWNSGNYSASMVWGCSDTRGLIDCAYNTPVVTFGGCHYGGATNDNPSWYMKLIGTASQSYTFPSSSKTLCATDGSNASGTWSIGISGNAATATKLATARTINGTSFNGTGNITTTNWGTARTLTIGSTGKSVNGSGNVSWSLSEIGAAASSHNHDYIGNSLRAVKIDKSVSSSSGGWFRVAKLSGSNTTGHNYLVAIQSSYNSPHDIESVFSISCGHCEACITQLSNSGSVSQINSIRVMRTSSSTGDYYLEVYYTGSSYTNFIRIVILNFDSAALTTYNWTATDNAYTVDCTLALKGSSVVSNKIYGAVWNDYAEYRQSDITIPGYCIVENGDDNLIISTQRLQRGAEIISDTFGFAIGETEQCKTPIATTGRVLAYGYEPREEFKSHIGYPVCSGPNGTVSIMTEEEEKLYPSRIIGFVSAVPDYEEWGSGNVKVNGRIWIRVR